MFKHIILAAAAVFFSAPALAQAAPIAVELEGIIEDYDHPTRTLMVMGMKVEITDTTVLKSPTTTRAATGLGINPWMKGVRFKGRVRNGFLDGTAIVIGTWDAANRKIVATEVTMEPGENVNLSVITGSFCSNANCDAQGNYMRSATRADGTDGPIMLPIPDPRLAAGTINDESGFAISLAGVNLNGRPFAAEGYYGSVAIAVPSVTGTGTVMEKAFHYFLFDLVGYFPDLLITKNAREVNAFRAQCRVGKDFEVRGHNHTLVTATGVQQGTIAPTNGVISVQYTVNGVAQRFNAAATAVDVGSPIGIYRVRFTPPGNTCPETINVRWLPAANSVNTAAYASTLDYPVEIRAD